jgi:hypothetical protein
MDMNSETMKRLTGAFEPSPEAADELSAKIYATGLAAAADLYRRNRIGEAAEVYAYLVEMRPGRTDGLVGLGHCLIDVEDPFRAIEVAMNITAIEPDNASGWLISGKAQLMLGILDGAVDDFTTGEECAREAGRKDLIAECARLRAAAEVKQALEGTADA